MRAIQVTCPNCGARLNMGDGDVVTCEYCGTASRVQRRTRILQTVLPPPAASSNRPAQIAVQTRSRAPLALSLGFGLVFPLALGGFITFMQVRSSQQAAQRVQRQVQQSMDQAQSALRQAGIGVRPDQRPPSWQATDTALLTEINGDGTPDIVGRGRQVNAGDVIRLIGLDGKTGQRLWQSDVLGTYTDTYRGPLVVSRDLAVFASDKGEVQAFSTKTGQRAWKVSLPERVSYFCEDDASVIAVTADNMLRPLARADGTARPATQRAAPRRRGRSTEALCPRLLDDDETVYERTKQGMSWDQRNKLDVEVDAYIDGDGVRVLAATRKTGTRVTMLVVLDDKGAERWRVDVAREALTATGAPRNVTVGGGHVCALYYSTEYRIGCFALADGARVWDAEAPSTANGLQISKDALVITTARNLEVRELTTGKVRWSMD